MVEDVDGNVLAPGDTVIALKSVNDGQYREISVDREYVVEKIVDDNWLKFRGLDVSPVRDTGLFAHEVRKAEEETGNG